MHHYFYNTIYQLRTKEEIILYDKLFDIKEGDEALVKEFLQVEFNIESKNHPFFYTKIRCRISFVGSKDSLYCLPNIIVPRA